MLCADLVDVRWKDKNGRVAAYRVANLEDISLIRRLRPRSIIHTASDPRCRSVTQRRAARTGVLLHLSRNRVFPWRRVRAKDSDRSQRSSAHNHLLDPRRLVSRVTNRIVRQNFPHHPVTGSVCTSFIPRDTISALICIHHPRIMKLCPSHHTS